MSEAHYYMFGTLTKNGVLLIWVNHYLFRFNCCHRCSFKHRTHTQYTLAPKIVTGRRALVGSQWSETTYTHNQENNLFVWSCYSWLVKICKWIVCHWQDPLNHWKWERTTSNWINKQAYTVGARMFDLGIQ